MSQDGYTRWVRRTDTPLLALAVGFLIVLILPYTVNLTSTERRLVTIANLVIWAAFAVDYLARLYLAENRRAYVRHNVLDLVIVVVPFLRPIRALRLLRLLRVGALAGVLNRRAASLHARVSTYVGSAAVVVVVLAAALVYGSERHHPGANIRTFPDALWWAATTITTVGYGDRYPTTAEGRLIAVSLMLVGIALLGVITASIAAWFVARLNAVQAVEEREEETLGVVLAELRRVHERLDRIEQIGPPPSTQGQRGRGR